MQHRPNKKIIRPIRLINLIRLIKPLPKHQKNSAPLREISPQGRESSISLRPPRPDELPALEQLYTASFPAAERRPWAEIAAGNARPLLLCIDAPGHPAAGMVSLWRFPQFTYIEHLCTQPSLRGQGIGRAAVEALRRHSAAPLLLEAEPAAAPGGIEERRIAFYRRCGLEVLPGSYIQPPYGPGLPAVPLLLMATEPRPDAAAAARTLYENVYRWPTNN